MANIQTLSVSLVAHTSGFRKGLDSAQSRLKAFSAGALASAGRIGGFGAALVGAAGGAGLATLTKHSFHAVDSLSKLSSRLGIGVEDLQAFEHSATLAHVSQKSLATGLQFMNRNLGQASLGSTKAQTAFAQLGLTWQQLQAAGPAEAFRTIADRIALLGTASQRAAAAQAIFGRGGVQLLNVLSQGRAGLNASAQELQSFGAVVSEQGAAQIELADEALKRAHVAFSAIGNVFAVAIAPLVTEAAERFIAWAQEGGGAGQRIREMLGSVVDALAFVGRGVDLIQAAFEGALGLVKGLFGAVQGLWEMIVSGAMKVANFFKPVTDVIGGAMAKAWEAVGAGAAKVADFVKPATDALAGFVKPITEGIAKSGAGGLFGDAFKNIREAFGAKGQTAIDDFFNAAQKRAAETAKTLTAPKLTESLTALSKDQLAGPAAAKGATDIGQALSVNLSRTVIGTLGGTGAGRRVQQVESPQLVAIVDLLRQYLAGTKGGAVAA